MRIVVAMALGIALGTLGTVVAQQVPGEGASAGRAPVVADPGPDPRSSLELCRVELVAVRSQLVDVDARASALQTAINRQAITLQQQALAAEIAAAHPGCIVDWTTGGGLNCSPDDEENP